jgi:hypothetical protein
MYVYEGFGGSTPGGLAVGASVACFIDELGNSFELTLINYGVELCVYYHGAVTRSV